MRERLVQESWKGLPERSWPFPASAAAGWNEDKPLQMLAAALRLFTWKTGRRPVDRPEDGDDQPVDKSAGWVIMGSHFDFRNEMV